MCRKVIALYDLCYDTPSRPSTCNSSRPVNSPHNGVSSGLQRCSVSVDTPCPESWFHPTINLPLVARTCSNACERELNPEYWVERQKQRGKEYNPFLDRMLCLGRDCRLYHVVTGECVANEEQFGDEPPVEREAYVGMLPHVPWEGSSLADRRGTVIYTGPPIDSAAHHRATQPSPAESSADEKDDNVSSHISRTASWRDYRSQLRALRDRGRRSEPRWEGEATSESPCDPCGRSSTSRLSRIGGRLVKSKASKRCLVDHES